MQAKPKEQTEEKGPPSPGMVLALSLFAYPGVGHLIIGRKKLGIVLVVGFTLLTLGLCYEIWVLAAPILRMYTSMGGTDQAAAVQMPSFGRMVFWVLSTGIVWLGSGIHSFFLAKKLQGSAEVSATPKS